MNKITIKYTLLSFSYQVIDFTDDSITTHRTSANANTIKTYANSGSNHSTTSTFVQSVSNNSRTYSESNYPASNYIPETCVSWGGSGDSPTDYGMGVAPTGALRLGTSASESLTFTIEDQIDCIKVDFGAWIQDTSTEGSTYNNYVNVYQTGIKVTFKVADDTTVYTATSLDANDNGYVPVGASTKGSWFIFKTGTGESAVSNHVTTFTITTGSASGIGDSDNRGRLYDIECFYNHEHPEAAANWWTSFLEDFRTCSQYRAAYTFLVDDYNELTPEALNYLAIISISDYSREDYINAGGNYDAISKTENYTTSAEKWAYICELNGVTTSHPLFGADSDVTTRQDYILINAIALTSSLVICGAAALIYRRRHLTK